MLSVLLAVLAAASNALASVLQRKANRDEAEVGSSGWRSLAHLLRRPLWLGGLSGVLVSFALQASALSLGALSLVQPVLSMELPLTLVLASRVFQRPLARRDWVAIFAMSGGLALLLLGLQPHGGDPARPSGTAWLLGAGTAGLLLLLLVVLAFASKGSSRAALLGMASGVSFALTAVFMSAGLAAGLPEAFTHWQTYLLALTGLVAMLLLQVALRTGSLVAVQPGVTLADPVVAILLGVLLFSEQVRAGVWLIADGAGALALAGGTFRLAYSPVFVVSDAEEPGKAHRRPAQPPVDSQPV